jgi:hypothetical protein
MEGYGLSLDFTPQWAPSDDADMDAGFDDLFSSFGSVHPSQSASTISTFFHPSSLIDQSRHEHPHAGDRAIKKMAKQQWLAGLREFSDDESDTDNDELAEPVLPPRGSRRGVSNAHVPPASMSEGMGSDSGRDEGLWQRKLQYYAEKGFPHSYDLWHEHAGRTPTSPERGLRISVESFEACMRFVEGLTSAANLERAMRVIRTARIGSGRCVVRAGAERDQGMDGVEAQPTWVAGLLEAYGLEQRAHGMYTQRNLVMSRMTAELGASHALLDLKHQQSLKRLMPQEFARWSAGQWDSLARNVHRWQVLAQHPDWGGGTLYGLALLLPMSWEWNVKHSFTRVAGDVWCWFVDRLQAISPNLFQLAHGLNEYGVALLMDQPVLPPLLQMEIQPTRDLNLLRLEEVGGQVRLGEAESRDVAEFYESLMRPPQNWLCTVQLAQGRVNGNG